MKGFWKDERYVIEDALLIAGVSMSLGYEVRGCCASDSLDTSCYNPCAMQCFILSTRSEVHRAVVHVATTLQAALIKFTNRGEGYTTTQEKTWVSRTLSF